MLLTVEQVSAKIGSGLPMMIAGDEAALAKLPKGSWIGGSIPYFIDEAGGVFSKDKLFVTELDPAVFKNATIATYDERSIAKIAADAPEDGLSFLILPFGSKVHLEYAQKAPEFEQMFLKPIVGWISGVAVDEIGKKAAVTFDGRSGERYVDKAVCLRCSLPKDKAAKIGLVNIFSQGTGDAIEFDTEGFEQEFALVNGKKVQFADYVKASGIDTKLPLVGDFGGARINVSFQSIDEARKLVRLYAPVFKNVTYRVAAPVGDYATAFDAALKGVSGRKVAFSCNCILNYLYGGLEGKRTGGAVGPITFGEIAYQLVNQTLVFVEV
jgi:hypothetical protein